MKNRDALELNIVFEKLAKSKVPGTAYVNALNMTTIAPYIEALRKASEPGNAAKQFDQQKGAILAKYAKKDEQGNPIYTKIKDEIGNDLLHFDIEDQASLEKEMQELLKQDGIETVEKEEKDRLDKYTALLEENIDEPINLRAYKLSSMALEQLTDTYDLMPLVKHNLVEEDV
jgi:hypothetical protein